MILVARHDREIYLSRINLPKNLMNFATKLNFT